MNEDIVKEIIKANATEVYKDSTQPAVRVLGTSLAQCVSLFATPIGRMALIFEKNIHKFLNKLDGMDDGQLVEPDTRIIVPILEKLRYIEDEKVSDYYTEILAAASKKDQEKLVSLSYIEILNRVTADELMILEYINSEENKIDISSLTQEDRDKYKLNEGPDFLSIKGVLPVVDVRLPIKKDAGYSGYTLLIKNFNVIDEKIKLNNYENINSYLDNLISLGLLHKPFGESLAIKPIYNHLKNHKKVSLFEPVNGEKLDFNESRIDVTDLCKNLLNLCQKNEN